MGGPDFSPILPNIWPCSGDIRAVFPMCAHTLNATAMKHPKAKSSSGRPCRRAADVLRVLSRVSIGLQIRYEIVRKAKCRRRRIKAHAVSERIRATKAIVYVPVAPTKVE